MGNDLCSDDLPPHHAEFQPMTQLQLQQQQQQGNAPTVMIQQSQQLLQSHIMQTINQSQLPDPQILGTSRAYSHHDRSQLHQTPGIVQSSRLDQIQQSQIRNPEPQSFVSPKSQQNILGGAGHISSISNPPVTGQSQLQQQQLPPHGMYQSIIPVQTPQEQQIFQSQFQGQLQSTPPQQQQQFTFQNDPQYQQYLEQQKYQEEELKRQQEEALKIQQQQQLEEQQKTMLNQQEMAKRDYQTRLKEDLANMKKHQSLDEQLLPAMHQYFTFERGEDGSETVEDIVNGSVHILRHKLNPSFALALKVITTSSYEEWEQQEREFQLHKLEFTHPHMVNIHIIHSRKFLCMCSATFRLCLVLDSISTNMNLLAPTKHYYEDELWQILDATVDVLYILSMKGIAHQNVTLSHIVVSQLIDDKSIYKLVYIQDEKPFYSTIKKNIDKLPKQTGDPSKNGEPLYLSPTQWDSLIQQIEPQHNPYKSDVFILGMVMLHLALGPSRHQELEGVYKPEGFSGQELKSLIEKVKPHYSKQLMEALQFMLTVNELDRPDFLEMSLKMNKYHSKKLFSHKNVSANYIYTIDVQKRLEQKKQISETKKPDTIAPSPVASLIPSHFSELKQLGTIRHDRTHNDEEEFIIEQFLLSGIRVEERHRDKREFPDAYYDGEILNGQREGIGQAHFKDGRMYDGCWAADMPHGQGTLYGIDGFEIYKGKFVRGEMTGFGIQRNPKSKYLTDPINFKNLNGLQDYWSKYEGDHLQGQFHGFGSLEYTNHEKLVGAFQNGVPDGVGVFHTAHGCVNGHWDNGLLVKQL